MPTLRLGDGVRSLGANRRRSATMAQIPSEATVRRLRARGRSLISPLLKYASHHSVFGNKTIGNKGSFVYLVNQIFGTGILALPYIVRTAGWFPSFVANALLALTSSLTALMMLKCMTMMRGNKRFERRVEYITVVEYYLGTQARGVAELCFYVSVQSMNLVSIVVVSRAVDHFIITILGKTIVFSIAPQVFFGFADAVDNNVTGITAGYIVNAVVCLLLAHQNLEENMLVQYLSFAFLLTSVTQLTIGGCYSVIKSFIDPSVVGVGPVIEAPSIMGAYNFSQLLSGFIASYSYAAVIPSWANEMTADVHVSKLIWTSAIFSAVVYYLFGIVMSTAYSGVQTDNILTEVMKFNSQSLFMHSAIIMFDLLTVAPSVVVYCITTRYNLVVSRNMSEKHGFITGCFLPFCIAWVLSNDYYFATILTWSNLIFSLACNFIIPCLVYLRALRIQPSQEDPHHHLESGLLDGLPSGLEDLRSPKRHRSAAIHKMLILPSAPALGYDVTPPPLPHLHLPSRDYTPTPLEYKGPPRLTGDMLIQAFARIQKVEASARQARLEDAIPDAAIPRSSSWHTAPPTPFECDLYRRMSEGGTGMEEALPELTPGPGGSWARDDPYRSTLNPESVDRRISEVSSSLPSCASPPYTYHPLQEALLPPEHFTIVPTPAGSDSSSSDLEDLQDVQPYVRPRRSIRGTEDTRYRGLPTIKITNVETPTETMIRAEMMPRPRDYYEPFHSIDVEEYSSSSEPACCTEEAPEYESINVFPKFIGPQYHKTLTKSLLGALVLFSGISVGFISSGSL